MVFLLESFSVIRREEVVLRQWSLIVNLFKKGDKEDQGNYRGITILSVVGKVFCKILNNRLVQCVDEYCMKDRLGSELIQVAWIMFTL